MSMIHQCKENRMFSVVRPETRYMNRNDKRGQWVLVYGNGDNWNTTIISYCPFCGRKLMPPTENNRDD